MNDGRTHRPVTSKARGFCKYYTTPRGCFNADSCRFLHASQEAIEASGPSEPPVLTPYDKAKRCRFYAQGYCRRGSSCWFLHVPDPKDQRPMEDEEDEFCSICFDKPQTYGLLTGCSHVFCLTCLRQWRDPTCKNRDMVELDNTKKCPMCRATSRYIIPSSVFFKEGQEEKKVIIEKYKESMSKVLCKHFEESKARNPCRPMCPFGKDCFYRHVNADGTPYVFKQGVDASMRTFHRRRAPTFDFFMGESLRNPFGRRTGLAQTLAVDMFDSIMTEVIQRTSRNNTDEAPRQDATVPDGATSFAREQMMTNAMNAIRSELLRLEGTRSNPASPSTRGTGHAAQTPSPYTGEWISDSDDVMDGLDLIAEQMIGLAQESLRMFDVARAPPTPPPAPQAPVEETITFADGGGVVDPSLAERMQQVQQALHNRRRREGRSLHPVVTQDDDDEDDIPELESISDSSSDNVDMFSDSSDSDMSDSEEIERVRDAVRSLDFMSLMHPTRSGSNAADSGPSSLPARRVESSSTRFSTVVGRSDSISNTIPEQAGPTEELTQEEMDNGNSNTMDEPPLDVVTAQEPPFVHSVEPPFVTDGRGRVVWTNKSSDGPDLPAPPPSGDASVSRISSSMTK